jgi:hypothetical protein
MIEGCISTKKDDNEYSPPDQAIHDLHTQYAVGYAGKLAGYRPGIYWQNGERILITKGPILSIRLTNPIWSVASDFAQLSG